MTTTEQFEAVVDFMTIAGQEVKNEFKMPSLNVGNFRLNLINEEINGKNELVDSLNKDNPIGVLDGICDVLYVVYGALATFGLSTPEWKIPDVNNEEKYIPEMHITLAQISHIKGGFDRTRRGLEFGDQPTINAGLINIIDSIIDLSIICGLDVAGAFSEVHASNMAKFCKSHNEAMDSINHRYHYEKNEDYKDAYIVEVVEQGISYFVIKRGSDGKVLKGLNFFEPNLSKFITK